MKQNYDIRQIVADNLRKLRTKNNLSQLELATRTGLTLTFVNNIENRKKWVSDRTLALFCRELDAYPFQFFLTDDIPGPDSGYLAIQETDKIMLAIQDLIATYNKNKL